MAWVWTVMLIGFIVLEAATVQFVSIWFAGGAFAGLICAVLGAALWLQITVFFLTTVVLLLFTKKFVKKLKKGSGEKTNVDALVGEDAIVTEVISNVAAHGAVKVHGMVWSARSKDGNNIQEGTIVTIEKIDGVKLIVTPKD